jgi:D-tyrosyl-tRNA(Tyr) deacylase
MRAVLQRVSSASVTVDGAVVAAITGQGLLVFLGVTHGDGQPEVERLARKIWELRIMREEKSAAELGAPVLVVSQFTLYADTRKGRRPSWSPAAPAEVSEPLYQAFCAELASLGARVEAGIFGAQMGVALVNDGPVTLLLESASPR